MTYKNCDTSDEQKQELLEELDSLICLIISKFEETIPPLALSAYLIGKAKGITCSLNMNYHLTTGLLTEMLNYDLEEVYENLAKKKLSKKDEKGEE